MSRQQVLVNSDWVEEHQRDDNVVLVEVDEDTTAYDGGHIAGAIKLDWKKDLQDPVRRDFVTKEQFEKLLSERGISNDDTVVLYGGNNNWFAAYAYWYFKLYGHKNVLLLDGGRKKWELEARELTTETVTRPATSYTAEEPNPTIRAYRDEVVKAIGSKSLVDVRSPDEYAGRLLAPAHLPQEQAQRGGHIPTAINVPWSKAANDDGTFKSDDDLQELYGEAGLDFSKDIIAYCRIGERSAHTWFVLHEILGQPNVKNYDGSWTEYGSLVGVPVAVGDEPGQPNRRSDHVRSNPGRAQRPRHRCHQGGRDPGPRAARNRPGRRCVRTTAGLRRRVHRRGADVGHRTLPVLRQRRPVDTADPGARRQAGPNHPSRPRVGGRDRCRSRDGSRLNFSDNSLELGVEDERDGSIVHQMDLHLSTEDARGHFGAEQLERCDEGIDQRLTDLARRGSAPRRAPALAGVGVKSELADDQ